MFDENKYRESFSVIHASDNLLSEIEKATYKNVKQKRYIPRVSQIAMVCLALILIPGITVFAYNKMKSVVLFFDGDTTQIEKDIQVVEETAEGSQYRACVDSMLADSYSTILGISIEALSEDAKTELFSENFDIRDVLSFDYGETDASFISMSWKFSDEKDGEAIRNFAVRLDGLGAPNTIRLQVKEDDDSVIELNIDKSVESLSASAISDYKDGDYFIDSCELSATQITYLVTFDEPVQGDKIVEIYLRNADGSLSTLQQLAGNDTEIKIWHEGDPAQNTYRYTQPFSTVINPLSIVGVIMNGVEYSFLDAEYSTKVDIPESMKPFLSPFVERNSTFYAYASDICEKIGASIENSGEKYTIRYLNNTLVFHVGNPKVYLNGDEKETDSSAIMEGDELLIPGNYVDFLSVRKMMYYPEKGNVQPPEYWLITP